MSGLSAQMTVQTEYDLTIIQDELVPLAPSVPVTNEPSYFIWTIAIMLLLAVIAVVSVYVLRCIKYRKCYYGMLSASGRTGEMKDPGWNLMKLKQVLNETENRLVEQMV